jgi:excisionase family DNA binding protein
MSDLLSVPEAATVAGVSVRTMRRWVTNGQVRSVGNGHKRRVVAASLSELPATNGQNGHDVDDGNGHERPASATGSDVAVQADRLADLVRELSDRLADQTAMTALWMERARVLGEQLALTAPEAPQDAKNGTLNAPTAMQGPEPYTGPSAPSTAPEAATADRPNAALRIEDHPYHGAPRSPWWRRWLAAVYG